MGPHSHKLLSVPLHFILLMWMAPLPASKKAFLIALPHLSWAHTTCPLLMSKSSSHTVPHCPECTSSTRPAQRSRPPINLTAWCSGGRRLGRSNHNWNIETKVEHLSKHIWEDLRWLTANDFCCICAVAFCACSAVVQFWVFQDAACKTSAIVHRCSRAVLKNVAATKKFTDLESKLLSIQKFEGHMDCSVLVKRPEHIRAALGQTQCGELN